MPTLCRVALQLVEDGRALQFFTGAGVVGIDRVAPGSPIFLVDKLRHRNLREVGIAHEFRSIEEGAAEGLSGQVNGLCRAIAQLGEIVTFQDVENLNQSDAPRGWRGSADDVIAAIASTDRFALFDLVGGKIGGGNQASALMDCCGQLAGYFSVIKIIGIPDNLFQGLGQSAFPKNLARFGVAAAALENPPRLPDRSKVGIM